MKAHCTWTTSNHVCVFWQKLEMLSHNDPAVVTQLAQDVQFLRKLIHARANNWLVDWGFPLPGAKFVPWSDRDFGEGTRSEHVSATFLHSPLATTTKEQVVYVSHGWFSWHQLPPEIGVRYVACGNPLDCLSRPPEPSHQVVFKLPPERRLTADMAREFGFSSLGWRRGSFYIP